MSKQSEANDHVPFKISLCIYVSGFAIREHLERTSDFELGIRSESTSDELPFALYCAALACFIAKKCLRKAWNDKKYVFEKMARNIYFR